MDMFFTQTSEYGLPLKEYKNFSVDGVDYVIQFEEITRENLYDCPIIFPDNYPFTERMMFAVSFDAKINISENRYYSPLIAGTVNAIKVFNQVVSIIYAHYSKQRSGMYLFTPASFRLSTTYCRLICSRRGTGATLEVGLQPKGTGHVLRTPFCYQP